MKYRQSIIHLLTPIILPIFIILVWDLAVSSGLFANVILPPPEKVGSTFIFLLSNGKLAEHLEASLWRILQGFALGLALGITIGILTGLSRPIDRLLNPTIDFIRTIPIYAWIPMLILWFGIGEASKIIAITMGVFFPVHLNTVEGIHNIDTKYIEVSKIFKLSNSDLIKKVVLPGALPFIITGTRLGLARAWMIVVVAELIAATSGLGYLISDGRTLFQPDVMIVGMLTIGIAGISMDTLISKIERRILRWRVRFEGYREISL